MNKRANMWEIERVKNNFGKPKRENEKSVPIETFDWETKILSLIDEDLLRDGWHFRAHEHSDMSIGYTKKREK